MASTLLSHLNRLYRETAPSESLEDLLILCIGTTACGTSTFINRLLEDCAPPTSSKPVEIGQGQSSCTRKVDWISLVPKSPPEWAKTYNVYIANTPGFDNSEPNLKDHQIVRDIIASLDQRRRKSGKPCRLGILLLQDVRVDRAPLAKAIADINIETNRKVLRHSTIVTTKWPSEPNGRREQRPNRTGRHPASTNSLRVPPTTSCGGDGFGSSEETLQVDSRADYQESERHHDRLATMVSGLLSADAMPGAKLDACKTQADGWRIVRDLVQRVDAGNFFIHSDPFTQAQPQSPGEKKSNNGRGGAGFAVVYAWGSAMYQLAKPSTPKSCSSGSVPIGYLGKIWPARGNPSDEWICQRLNRKARIPSHPDRHPKSKVQPGFEIPSMVRDLQALHIQPFVRPMRERACRYNQLKAVTIDFPLKVCSLSLGAVEYGGKIHCLGVYLTPNSANKSMRRLTRFLEGESAIPNQTDVGSPESISFSFFSETGLKAWNGAMPAPHTIFPRLLATMGKLYLEPGPTPDVQASTNIFIMCTGITGCGISTFINQLIVTCAEPSMTPMEVGSGLSPCTKHVRWTQVFPTATPNWARRYNIFVCDVPGFNRDANGTTDLATLQELWTSLHERVQQSTDPCLLGLLILKDVTADRETWRGCDDDIALIKSTVDRGALEQLTIATTKWSLASNSSGIGVYEEHQSQMQKSLQPLLSEGTVLDACKSEDDAWRIVQNMVERVEASHYTISSEALQALCATGARPKPVERSSWKRLCGMMCCISSAMDAA
ncbi:hypothetical protein NMY22_g5151 [Coprinellus aureogranulatus]|nr:hypothetical protein NMY22_g5151 [Coprinellus aureogranulatus]